MSCGCRRTVQAISKAPEYTVYESMLQRCLNPKTQHYNRYGGRGIKVCERWQESYRNFIADIGPRPTAKHELDRRDNDGDYCPENCRWVIKKHQCRNRSSNTYLEIGGIRKTIAGWAEVSGVPRSTISARLRVMKWSPADAVFKPVDAKKGKRRSGAET